MNHRGNYFFLVLFISASYLAIRSYSCSKLKTKWTVYITNAVPDDIVVHIKSTDHDLGNHTISSNEVYSWTFCQKYFGTHFHGYFWWGSRYQSLALADQEILNICRIRFDGDEDCYWLVLADGFYVSASNKPFPDGWYKKKSW
ncbi:plant self-incompatibility S1 [Artemisia annua]|uniref:S-protein homolog n=1 Tax=Artemisia annua TaxID=35608 RepID=A0A2U1QG69_ARTAN|nr:plant self-incompatibility S1 [Artemisia annua]PWA99635.1 plant self-incompatibility S1 [Artemisia annua]